MFTRICILHFDLKTQPDTQDIVKVKVGNFMILFPFLFNNKNNNNNNNNNQSEDR